MADWSFYKISCTRLWCLLDHRNYHKMEFVGALLALAGCYSCRVLVLGPWGGAWISLQLWLGQSCHWIHSTHCKPLIPILKQIPWPQKKQFILVPYYAWRSTHHAHHKATMSVERDENFVPRTRTDYNLPPQNSAQISDYHDIFEETPIYTLGRMIFMQALGWQYYLCTNAMGSPMYPSGTNVSGRAILPWTAALKG